MNIDPKYCNRFIPCYNGTSYPSLACQRGLHFSFRQQRCMSAAIAGCPLLHG
uniref:Chitin-binding type-2 domain-containing protein n=1 Tax=Octopus bimaculoides TaxID=37653 RepID=A0A0L8I786_OCTBM